MSTTRLLAKVFQNAARLQLSQYCPQYRCRNNFHASTSSSSKYESRSHLTTSTTSRASLTSSLPSQPTILLYQPTQADIADEELDVDLLPPERVKLEITDRAAEVCRGFLFSEEDSRCLL
jgi:hypothetical protein